MTAIVGELLEPASGQDRHFAGQSTSLLHNANMAFEESLRYAEDIEDKQLRRLALVALRQTLNKLDADLQSVEADE